MREADDVMRPHDLRLVQLRAFIRLLDSAPHSDEASNRILAMQTMMSRAREDRSPLRRAVHVAMTRAADALLRNNEIDLTDLLLTWPSVQARIIHSQLRSMPELILLPQHF